ncbi:hypothetical protein KKA14_15690 [bacterium]|nr:hypothetical protein [bacterium]
MKTWTKKRKSRKNSVSFNPNHRYVKSAVEEFLDKGGKITKVIVDERSYGDFLLLNELPSAADDFLNGI